MTNKNTKYWFFTWETNVTQRKLPTKERLKYFLDATADYAQFQEERGALKGKLHYQGCFELAGSRQSKKVTLDLFKDNFKNVAGLTLSKVFSKDAVMKYTSKQETQVSETVYCGKKEMYSTEIKSLCNKQWQQDLFDRMKKVKYDDTLPDSQRLRKRSIYWLEDPKGGSGKSEFITWLRAGQKDLICRLLPMDSVDRLIHAVTEITKHEKVDVFMIDDTRTKGDNTSFSNMFEAIERIKNGHVVSTMYGRYAEVMYARPQILFCTNRRLDDYRQSLSLDRWYQYEINKDQLQTIGWQDRNYWDTQFGSNELKKSEDLLTDKPSEKYFDQILEDLEAGKMERTDKPKT